MNASYWDTDTSVQTDSAGGTGYPTNSLQSPTSYTGIYADWDNDSTDHWDFGSDSEYPVLKTDLDGDDNPTWQEFGDQRPQVDHDYDTDDDGLIEIANLAQLDALRHDINGAGSADHDNYQLAFPHPQPAMGCSHRTCLGYELAIDLNFDTDGDVTTGPSDHYWNDGAGWRPIAGTGYVAFYNATFEGNGHTISNLFINDLNNNDVGLFAGIGVKATIRNLGLQSASVTGRQDVGALVGYNRAGNIRATYATGSVTGHDWVGGLVGDNIGGISRSYSQVLVSGERKVGGLAGKNSYIIQSSYASGSVQGTNTVGGLVGENSGDITHSYSTGLVDAPIAAGGLTGRSRGKESQSYWDTETSGQSTNTAGTGKTTAELQAPTDYTGIYETWKSDNREYWDFRDATNYPALKADFDQNGAATSSEFGNQ